MRKNRVHACVLTLIGVLSASSPSLVQANESLLTLSGEARLRYDRYGNAQLVEGSDFHQGLFRGVLGADLALGRGVRVYGEVATGQVEGRRHSATANFQNQASLQQLFADVRTYAGTTLIGAIVGRQEFSDGPRQLISLSDGPNIHRTWNGTRVYVHDGKAKWGAFDLRVTRQQRGAFDEEVNRAEKLRGLNASILVSASGAPDIYWDPFWLHTENPSLRSGGQVGLDARDTFGMRLWGRRGDVRFDWTVAHQRGSYIDRDVDALGLFTVQSLPLSTAGWKPRLTARVDVASGGAYRTGTLRGFNQLYASSSYLGEGQFLSLSNLLMFAPGVAFAPTPRTAFSVEYGFARRLKEDDAVYAGGMRAYPGTQNVPGHQIGSLFRATSSWKASEHLSLFLNVERLVPGKVLRRAHLPAGNYAYVGATYRY